MATEHHHMMIDVLFSVVDTIETREQRAGIVFYMDIVGPNDAEASVRPGNGPFHIRGTEDHMTDALHLRRPKRHA